MRGVSDGIQNGSSVDNGELDLGSVGRAIARRKFWIIGSTLGCLACAAAFVTLATPRYTAETKVLVENQESYFTRPSGPVAVEQQAQGIDPEAVAITLRAPLLTGNSLAGTRSLHERLFADWSAGKTPRVFADEIRQPCTSSNLADLMLELLERNDVRGVYHWAGADALTRLELARRIRAHFKLSETAAPIAAVTRAEDPLAASKRQANLSLDLAPLAGKVKTPIETFDAQLDQFVIPVPFRAWYQSV